MVEREAQLDRGAPAVAAVIYNRLKRGHAARDRRHDPLLRRTTGRARCASVRARARHARTTRACNRGLPPTPIGNPGLASIKAAANPAQRRSTCSTCASPASPASTRSRRPTRSSSATSRATRPPASGHVMLPRRLRLAGRPLALAGDAQRRRSRPLGLDDWRYLRAAAAAGAVRGDRAGAARGRLPRRQRDDPAQGGGARARRRRDRRRRGRSAPPTRSRSSDGAIHADNTDAPGLLAALRGVRDPRGTQRARARRGRRRARRGRGRSCRPGAPRSRVWNRTPERAAGARRRARRARRRRPGARRHRRQLHVGRASRPRGHRSRRSRSRPMTWVPEAAWWTWSTGHGGTRLLEAARTRGARRGRRTGDPGRPGRCVVRTLDRPDGSRAGDAGGRRRHRQHMNPPTQTGARTQASGNGASPRRRGAAAPAACSPTSSSTSASSSAATMDEAIERANDDRLGARAACCVADGTLTEDQLARAVAERFGLDHIDLAHLPRRPRRRQARHARRRHAATRPCPVSFVGDRTLLVAMADPANVLAVDDIAVMTGYEVRPAVASPRGHRAAARAPRGPRLRQRRGRARPRRRRGRRRRRPPPRPGRRPPARCTTSATERADQLRRRRRGRVGHPARAPGDQGGRRARRLRHPLRARRRRDARPLPHRRRAPGGRDGPRERRPGRRLAREDPLRPRHRRAPHPAGRPHLARGRRQADRPPRRHAAVPPTARTSSCASSTRARS